MLNAKKSRIKSSKKKYFGLSRKITKDDLLNRDTVQPIIEFLHSSIMKYDCEIVEECLERIKDGICDMFNEEKFAEEEEKIVSGKGKKVKYSCFPIISLYLYLHISRFLGSIALS